jgi:leader peptidase (prepilin peptidase)/N-methyltransferase
MTWFHRAILAAFGFGLGASVGSFLNVCIWRLPRGESLIRPASRCPRCGSSIVARDNVPILSWLALSGRCRQCAGPISARYPLVEGVVGLLFAVLFVADLPLDRFDRGPVGVLAPLTYHLALVSLLVTAATIVRDRRTAADPVLVLVPGARARASSLGLATLPFLTLVAALAGSQANDLVGSGLNALLLAVFVLASIPPHSTLGRAC